MFKRMLTCIFAIFFAALGIAIATSANLGTSPIGSFPYVLTFICSLSFGTTTFIVNAFFILLQKLLLGKEFRKIDYLQFVVILFFASFIDLGMYLASFINTRGYLDQFIMLIAGSVILAFGISLEVKADLLYIPGEGVVKAVVKRFNFDFGKSKIGFDIAQCIIAIVLSLIFLHKIEGIREGTIISAIMVGPLVSVFHKLICKTVNK